MRSGSSRPIANSRRMTSCSFLYSSGGRVEFIMASLNTPSAVANPIFRHVDPKNRPIKRGISIDVTPYVLDALRNLIGRLRFRSFEQHVLQNVGQSRAEMLVLFDASSGAPRLHTRHRRAAIFLHDDCQPVWQNPFLRRARRKRNWGPRIQVAQPSN